MKKGTRTFSLTLDLQSQLAEYAEEDFAISANSASELLHGVHRAANPAQRRRREAFVEGLLARLPIISFDAVAARPCSAFGRACSRWNGNQFAQSHHCRHCVGEGLYRHHSRRTQLSENPGIGVSTGQIDKIVVSDPASPPKTRRSSAAYSSGSPASRRGRIAGSFTSRK